MAEITTTFNPTPVLFPFDGLGEVDQRGTEVPRAAVVFVVAGGAVTLSGAGDTQRVVANLILPTNFSYVATDFNVRLQSADVGAWNEVGEISYADAGSSDRTFLASQELVSHGTVDNLATNISRIWCPCGPLLKALMLQVPNGSAPRCGVKIANPALNDAAGVLDLYARFLQYDINQTHHVTVNTATLVR